ncbi:MAG: response regulator, partial [Prochlorothrix sp.]
ITLNRRRLLATISHDIRTPLHGTLGMLKLLESSGLSAQQQVQLSLAQSSAESLLTLINDLLDLSSAEMGYLGLHRAPFNLYTCLDECIRPFALVAEEKGLNFILDLSGVADPEVEGDAKRLRQILAQLLSNALKFTEQGEILVQINLYELAGTLRLEGKVTDTGVGIPVDRLDSLFGHALLPPTSTRLAPHPDLTQPSPAFASSLDFGLSLVKRLCVLMGGDVQVDSAVGKGSCFTFSLNLQPIYPKPAPFHPLGLAGASLLVVVPNLTQRLVLQHQLEAWGLTVVSVGSGAQALQATPPPDAVTFDVVLMAATVLDELGWDWMQQLPAETGLAHVPWVLLKPMHRSYEAISQPSASIQAVLDCPFLPPDLATTLATALTRPVLSPRSPSSLDSEPVTTDLALTPSLADLAAQQRVLLVEDHPVNQIVAEGLLNELGFWNLDIVDQGDAALEALRNTDPQTAPYTLILMDCQMPGMDGYETTQQIREGAAGHDYVDVLIIAMTAHALQGDRDKCLRSGMDDYIAKPMDLTALSTLLHHWLQPDAAPQELPVDPYPEATLSFNPDLLLQRLGQRLPLAIEACQAFLDCTPNQLQDMKQCLAVQDWDGLGCKAHSLKSTSAMVGDQVVQQLSLHLEEQLQAEQYGALAPILQDLERQLVILQADIQTWLSQQQSASHSA